MAAWRDALSALIFFSSRLAQPCITLRRRDDRRRSRVIAMRASSESAPRCPTIPRSVRFSPHAVSACEPEPAPPRAAASEDEPQVAVAAVVLPALQIRFVPADHWVFSCLLPVAVVLVERAQPEALAFECSQTARPLTETSRSVPSISPRHCTQVRSGWSLGVFGAEDPLIAGIPLFIRYTATKPVVIGFLAFSIRYIGFGCSGLKQVTCAHFIGVVAV